MIKKQLYAILTIGTLLLSYSETILSGQPKKRRLPPSYFFRRFIWLSRKAYAATTGTSQPSAFNFLRYALILRSLLN